MHRRKNSRLVGFATAFDEQLDEPTEFVIPTDLASLNDEDLSALAEQASQHFDQIYGEDGADLTDAELATLASLTEGIVAIQAEQSSRDEAASERAAKARELAAQVRPEPSEDDEDEDEDDLTDPHMDEDEDDEVSEAGETEEVTPEVIAASSARKEVRVSLSSLRNRRQTPRQSDETTARDVLVASGNGNGYEPGTGVDMVQVGEMIDKRLKSYSHGQFAAAAKSGRHMRQQFSIASIQRPMDLRFENNDPNHVREVLQAVSNEARLPGGSLLAAGGWCAPSVTLYDLLELESRDGLFSIPEVGWTRGGISRTLGPDFADFFSADIGWDVTEEDDEAGDYDGEGGDKPCYRVGCPDFEEFRLRLAGLCIQAGLLQARGFPEMLARVVRGVLVAHDHRMAGKILTAIEAGSTAVTMPTPQQGVTAPLLTSIELQVEHYRYSTRIARGTTLEAVFPFWVRGAIRSDLSRRNGVNLLSVTDAQINAWFAERGVAPQFVYNFQDINTTDADAFTEWPSTVTFLLYAAGAWIRGVSDVITLDTIYDSQLIAQNDFTALFTEEGYQVVKMHHDSRAVTVPVCPDGSTGDLVPFDCDGTTLAPAAG